MLNLLNQAHLKQEARVLYRIWLEIFVLLKTVSLIPGPLLYEDRRMSEDRSEGYRDR